MTKLQRVLLKAGIAFALIAGLVSLLRTAGSGPHPEAKPVAESHERAEFPDAKTVAAVTSPGGVESTASLSSATVASRMKADSSDSSHPVERAVARGVVLDERIEMSGTGPRWTRTRLVQSNVQPRLVRVVEKWQVDAGAQQATCISREMFLADQLILTAAARVTRAQLEQQLEREGMAIGGVVSDRVFTVRLPIADLDAVPKALKFFAASPALAESVEPDGVGFGGGIPNDPLFGQQWGFHNTGQSGGTADADIDAPEFWDIMLNAPGIVVAVLDTGLNYTHPDLQGIAWTNPNEIAGDQVDNDGNGKVDDVKGWDFVNNDNDPTDDQGHGSNVTGVIAAPRNNGVGIAGLLGGVKILSCKILNSSNSGLTSSLIAATTYARLAGVPVMNLSLQSYPFSSTLDSEFTACQTAGIVLCICAGNQGVNNDVTPNYPSCHTQTNIIAVGNHDRTDVRWSGSFNPSNYGAASVDLYGPGRDILSPVLGTAYSNFTGTSQATPFVTAICAAIKYTNPSWKAPKIKESILNSVVTKASYSGICVTGGRLNAVAAMAYAFRAVPTQDIDGDKFSNLFEYLAGSRIDNPASHPAVSTDLSGGLFRIGMPRVLRADAHLEIEQSPDLINWSNAGITDFSTSQTILGGISISGASRGFLRIRAVATP